MSCGLETKRRVAAKLASTILTVVSLLLVADAADAQEHSVTLKGLVFDSASGLALPDVAVHVNQNLAPAHTDSLGEFLLFGLSAGPHTLTLAKDGFAPRLFAVSVTEEHRDTVDLGSFPLAPADALTATISGTLFDARTGSPVVVSGVYVNGDLTNVSADGGQFTTGRIEVTPGLNMLEFKRIGYEPFQAQMWAVQEHTELDLAVHLIPAAVRVPTVVVEASYLREFNQRRQWGAGHYITQQEIEERHPLLISEMLQSTPGIRVLPGRFGGNRVVGTVPNGFDTRPCPPALFIDGHQVIADSDYETLDHLVHADNVAAMEVYPRPAQVPVQFKMRDAVCGVIVVWTRR